LIESHLPLVRALARRYAGRGAELDDLLQVGALGLIKATDRFDPRRGVAFASFAAPTIEGEIRHHLRDRTSSLRIPRELQAMSGKLRRCRDELAAALGRAPTVPELAEALAADERDVEQALAAERARDPIPISPDEDDALGLKDSSEPLAGSDDRLLMADTLRVLDERERRIVLLKFHGDMTERQIASELGISQAHVSRLLGGALAKLRDELANSSDAAGEGDTTAGAVISPNAARAIAQNIAHGRSKPCKSARTDDGSEY
jgi:RNA polymerase sigma-B factor